MATSNVHRRYTFERRYFGGSTDRTPPMTPAMTHCMALEDQHAKHPRSEFMEIAGHRCAQLSILGQKLWSSQVNFLRQYLVLHFGTITERGPEKVGIESET